MVEWLNGFIATAGDEFVLMTATEGIVGEFNSLDLPAVAAGLKWTLNYGTNEVRLGLTRLVDVTSPSARLNSLPLTTSTGEIQLTVNLKDPVGSNGATASGVDSYDVYVAVDNGPWMLWRDDVPATQTQLVYQAAPDRRYWFRTVAKDVAGNVEADPGLAETNTRVLDYAAPITQVDSITFGATEGEMIVNFSGTDIGSSGLKTFQVWASVDGGKHEAGGRLTHSCRNRIGRSVHW